jgi:DivIVA domain-containing protein
MNPEQVAGRSFPTSFRGYEQSEVRSFLATVAEELRAAIHAGELVAADIIAETEHRAADLLAEAQDEARRIRDTLGAERERAFAEGAARADDLIAEAERVRAAAEALGRGEAERLIVEARAVRERILGDLARRRATLREQVEQLHAARERLLAGLAELRTQVDEAAGDLRSSLPEAKMAADAAARRVAAEPLPTAAELEGEIAALRAAGLEMAMTESALGRDRELEGAQPESDDEAEPAAAAEAPAREAPEQPERRSATVRVFRTRRGPTPAIGLQEAELHAVDPAAPFEEVRLVTADDAGPAVDAQRAAEAAAEVVPEAGTAVEREVDTEPVAEVEREAEAEPAPQPDGDVEVEVEVEPEADTVVGVAVETLAAGAEAHAPPATEAIDELFARLKAERAERTAAAEVALATGSGGAIARPAQREAEASPAAVATAEPPAPAGVDPADAAELTRRDAAVGGAREALAKRLKRQLADEQNEVLHGLRRGDTRVFELDDADDHAAAWALAAGHELAVVANVGAAFDGGEPARLLSVSDVAVVTEALTDAYARPLRLKVLEVIDAADGDAEAAADAVRSVYRDRRGRRLDAAIDDAVLAAFSTGVLAAATAGTEFRWVVDDGATACPDCDDNGLAGSVAAGSPFPTGHAAPPAHPGCRCLLVRTRHQ